MQDRYKKGWTDGFNDGKKGWERETKRSPISDEWTRGYLEGHKLGSDERVESKKQDNDTIDTK